MEGFWGALLWVVLVGLFGESFIEDACWGILFVELLVGPFGLTFLVVPF